MIKTSVVGATGYAGVELLRLLQNHPEVEIQYLTSETYAGQVMGEVYPHVAALYQQKLTALSNLDAVIQESDVLFVALPHGHALNIATKAVAAGKKVIDLGADFRFDDAVTYEQWYKVEHTCPQIKRVYALPELHRANIKDATVVANPGCYPTATILGIAPLLKHGLASHERIVVDAKSGISGAGRGLGLNYHFAEASENVRSYSVAGKHRHTPEIEQELSKQAGKDIVISFSPHLMPMSRGILSTCYLELKENITSEQVTDAYQQMYGKEYFVRLMGEGGYPATKQVRGSNFCDIGWHIDQRTGRVVVISVIDNLVKGAAGQAVQNLNIISGLPETMGLDNVPVYP